MLQDSQLALLRTFTSLKNNDNLWAWIQLGICYLEQQNYPEAIDSLRHVIRKEPNNALVTFLSVFRLMIICFFSFCWESLADAYMARGSYTSSLKSYQKSLSLNSNSIYSQFQIANIKLVCYELTNFSEL